MLTQTCTQCHKQHLAEESLHNAKGQAFCSAYCLKAATGKPVAPELPPKKSLPLLPIVLAFACGFWVFWRVLAPSEVVDSTEQAPLDLTDRSQNETVTQVDAPREAVPERRPPELTASASATPSDEASLAPQTGEAADKSAKTAAETQSTKAFALARQAALLLPMDAPRAAVLAQESVTLHPNREAYRVLIQYAQDKDRAFEKDAYLKSCLGLSTDRKSADYCYIDKAPEEDTETTSEEDLFAPIPEPSLDPARRVSPPRLNESLSDTDP